MPTFDFVNLRCDFSPKKLMRPDEIVGSLPTFKSSRIPTRIRDDFLFVNDVKFHVFLLQASISRKSSGWR